LGPTGNAFQLQLELMDLDLAPVRKNLELAETRLRRVKEKKRKAEEETASDNGEDEELSERDLQQMRVKLVKEIKLKRNHPGAHSDTRLVRKLDNGHYLVAHENDGAVREYDEAGKVVWSYKIGLADRPAAGGHGVEGHGDHVYSAYRLPSSNTLIGCGNGNRVIEVTHEGKTVWSVEQKELPGITLAWVTMLEVLPNGNVVIGNCHAGPENPQLIEVTREKKVVWTLKDHKNLDNSTAASQVLGLEGAVIR